MTSTPRLFGDPSDAITAQIQPTQWWLKNPLSPGMNFACRVVPFDTHTKPVRAGTFYPKGRDKAVVISEPEKRGWEFDAEIYYDLEQEETLLALLESGQTMLLQDVLPQHWYVRVSKDLAKKRFHGASSSGKYPVGTQHSMKVPLVEVDVPLGDFVMPTEDLGGPGGGGRLKADSIGISTGEMGFYTTPQLAADFGLANNYAHWMRFGIEWPTIQTAPGAYDFSTPDNYLALALAAGYTSFLGCLGYTPAFVNGGHDDISDGALGNKFYPIPGMDAYVYDYYFQVVSRYKPGGSFGLDLTNGIRFWEIWNEPNIPSFGRKHGGNGSDVASYARLHSVAYAAIKAADPSAVVITGGVATCITNAPAGNNQFGATYNGANPVQYSQQDWYLNLFHDVGGVLEGQPTINGKFDGIGAHLYWAEHSPLHDWAPDINAPNYNPFLYCPYLYAIAVFAGNDPSRCRIWATEAGVRGINYWLSGEDYVVNERTFIAQGHVSGAEWVRATRYKCINAHTASGANTPPNATYWAADPDTGQSRYYKEADEQGWDYALALEQWFSEGWREFTGAIFFYNVRDADLGSFNPDNTFGLITKTELLFASGAPKGSGGFAVNGALSQLLTIGQQEDTRS